MLVDWWSLNVGPTTKQKETAISNAIRSKGNHTASVRLKSYKDLIAETLPNECYWSQIHPTLSFVT